MALKEFDPDGANQTYGDTVPMQDSIIATSHLLMRKRLIRLAGRPNLLPEYQA